MLLGLKLYVTGEKIIFKKIETPKKPLIYKAFSAFSAL